MISPDLILPILMMEPTDDQKTLEKMRANPVILYILVLMYPGEKITGREAEEHCLIIEDSDANPSTLPRCRVRSARIIGCRSAVKTEAMLAKDTGVWKNIQP